MNHKESEEPYQEDDEKIYQQKEEELYRQWKNKPHSGKPSSCINRYKSDHRPNINVLAHMTKGVMEAYKAEQS